MRLLLFIGFFFCLSVGYAQERYSKVKIFGDAKSLARLTNVALDHVGIKEGEYITGVFLEYELNEIKKSGLRYEVLVEDMTRHYLEHVKDRPYERAARSECTAEEIISPLDTITVPDDFALGSMGGFFKYEQMIAHLDNMAARYPNLISVKKQIGTHVTQQNRPIYWVKISDNVSQDEGTDETQILYTALHHAREPASLSQLIFYMYYLLENYGKIDYVTHIVNSREMIFVPCVNPDGYIYNQTTNPNGGGFWRKNRRANAGGSFGVDLNRNYSYQWGFSGTSSDPSSDVYKGTAPFSEPENKAIRTLCQQFNFKMAFNYHSHGDLLLFPFGYDDVQAPDHNRYGLLTEEMVVQNNYVNEQSVLLYPAAGDSDDYMYGNTVDKPRIFAMTPEIGDDFWISQSSIIPVCKENLWQNMSMALQADVYPLLTSTTESIDQSAGNLSFAVQARGLNSLQGTTLNVTSLSPALTVTPETSIGDLVPFQSKNITVPYEVAPGTPNGTLLQIACVVSFNNGKELRYVYKIRWESTDEASGQVIFEDDFTSMDKWTATGNWAITQQDFVSTPSCITDSPTGNYNNYVNMKIDTRDKIDLSGMQTAYLKFKARWKLESDHDYVQVSVIRNGVEYALCGNYSRVNSGGKVVYDGMQNGWITEQVNLIDFIGDEIKLRFRMKSDGSSTYDGFYLDDLSVIVTAQVDTNPPAVASIVPANDAVVETGSEIKVTFSENIVRGTGIIELRKSSDNAVVPSNIEVMGNAITVEPSTALEYVTEYYLFIEPTSVMDLSGNYFTGLSSANWSFTTVAMPDVVPPEITSYVPEPGSTNISEDQVITVTFDEELVVSTEDISLKDEENNIIPVVVTLVNELQLIITPVNVLEPGMTYTVIIPAGSVSDTHDNYFAGLTSTWQFTTIPVTGIELEEETVQLFPNPTADEVNIKIAQAETVTQIRLIDLVGKAHKVSWDITDDRILTVPVKDFGKGPYVLQILTEQRTLTFKLIIR